MSRMRPGERNLVRRVSQGVYQRIQADAQARHQTLNQWLFDAYEARLGETKGGDAHDSKRYTGATGGVPARKNGPGLAGQATVAPLRLTGLTRRQLKRTPEGRCFDCGCREGTVDPRGCRLFTCACHAA